MTCTLLAKVLGYGEKVILAYYFGTGPEVDVYMVLYGIIMSIFIMMRELVEPGFLNTFMRNMEIGNTQAAWALFNRIARFILVITLVILAAGVLLPEKIAAIFAPGFSSEKTQLLISLLPITLPAIVFLSISTLTYITLNAQKRFILPALSDLALKAMIIISIVILYQSYGIAAAAIGIVAAGIARLLIHLGGLWENLSLRKTNLDPSELKGMWRLTWPLLIGILFSQLTSLADNIFASYLQTGTVSALEYAKKIAELPVVIFPYVFSIVIFPYFSQLAIQNKADESAKLLSNSLKGIFYCFLPMAIFCCMFAHPIVEVLLQRGAFDSHSAALTSYPLFYYAIGMPVFAIETVLVLFYFANSDTKTPVFVGIMCAICNITLSYLLIKVMGHAGIALSLTISKGMKVFILLYALEYKLVVSKPKVIAYLGKMLLAGGTFFLFLFASKFLLYDLFSSSTYAKAGFLIVSFALAGIAYLLTAELAGLKVLHILKRSALKLSKTYFHQ